jgi:hypothetical protein
MDPLLVSTLTQPSSPIKRLNGPGFQPKAAISPNENPDRYAAAICIRVRPDCFLPGYSVGESWRLSVLRKDVTDFRGYPDVMRFFSNGYFFFFLAFFVFFAFFAFLAMLPSVVPKVGSMQVDTRHAFIETTPRLQN